MKKLLLTICALLVITSFAYAETYYVRKDGGTINECTGKVDVSINDSKDCAVSHIYWLLPIEGDNNKGVLQGGDTVNIRSGSYVMGYPGPNHPDRRKCSTSYAYGCRMKPIPSGTFAQPTRILGDCDNPPELWGAERSKFVISLVGSNNVELKCLEITDHSSCIENQGTDRCDEDDFPHGDWASYGIRATDSENVLIENVNIHGMAFGGIRAGRIKDWTLKDVVIRGNGYFGWDGDVGSDSSNSGDIEFINTTIEYSGCSEDYPITKTGAEGIHRCWSQNQGGYGDGIGTGKTGGNWYFQDCNISHNVSDGLDLLYSDPANGSLIINGGIFEGNAGNQIKSAFNTHIEDTKIIGNCAYFVENGIHEDIVWDGGENRPGWHGNCRALGNTVSFKVKKPGQQFELINNTITGQGDCLMILGGEVCDGTESLSSKNNIWVGGNQYYHSGDTCYFYASGATGNGDGACGSMKLNDEYSLVYNTKRDPCPKDNMICADPLFVGVEIGKELMPLDNENFDVHLQEKSPAIGVGVGGFDIGAFPYGEIPTEPEPNDCEDEIMEKDEEIMLLKAKIQVIKELLQQALESTEE